MDRFTSTDSKTFAVVVSPVEYIRKQQAVNPKKPNCGISAAAGFYRSQVLFAPEKRQWGLDMSRPLSKHMLFACREVRIGKNCALGLEYGPRPHTRDRGHSFSQYGPT